MHPPGSGSGILRPVRPAAAGAGRTAVGLARACHPAPTVAVTALSTVVAAAAGRGPAGCLLVAAAILSGQLSVGWSNDLLDRRRDLAAGRRDKPLAAGAVSPRAVALGCAGAVALCIPLSLAVGWSAGAVHLAAVAGGWAYNLGLKRTVWSFVPYAASFALLTAFLTLGLPGAPWPAPWLLLAGALLGVGAHFLNVVPDVEDDLAAGVRGLPQRLGATRAAVVGATLLALSGLLVVLGPPGPVPAWGWAGIAAVTAGAAGAAGAGAVGHDVRGDRRPFLLALATAGVAVALLVARGSALT